MKCQKNQQQKHIRTKINKCLFSFNIADLKLECLIGGNYNDVELIFAANGVADKIKTTQKIK